MASYIDKSANSTNADRGSDDDDEVPTLSAATLAALRMFAIDTGIAMKSNDNDDNGDGDREDGNNGGNAVNVIARVREHFDVKDRDQVFHCCYADETNEQRKIEFDVTGSLQYPAA
jgi:hypothetical protein